MSDERHEILKNLSRAEAEEGLYDSVPPQGPGKKQEVFVLSGGSIVVQWPDSMSAEDFQDIADWLPILERKIKRCVVPNT